MNAKELKDYATCELVEELKHREGVETTTVGPYEPFEVCGDGPATVFIVID